MTHSGLSAWVATARSARSFLDALPDEFHRTTPDTAVASVAAGGRVEVTVRDAGSHTSEFRVTVKDIDVQSGDEAASVAHLVAMQFVDAAGERRFASDHVATDEIPVITVVADAILIGAAANDVAGVIYAENPPGRPTPFWTSTWSVDGLSHVGRGVVVPDREWEELRLNVVSRGDGTAELHFSITKSDPVFAIQGVSSSKMSLQARARAVIEGYAARAIAALSGKDGKPPGGLCV